MADPIVVTPPGPAPRPATPWLDALTKAMLVAASAALIVFVLRWTPSVVSPVVPPDDPVVDPADDPDADPADDGNSEAAKKKKHPKPIPKPQPKPHPKPKPQPPPEPEPPAPQPVPLTPLGQAVVNYRDSLVPSFTVVGQRVATDPGLKTADDVYSAYRQHGVPLANTLHDVVRQYCDSQGNIQDRAGLSAALLAVPRELEGR